MSLRGISIVLLLIGIVSTPIAAQNLATYRWQKRLLLIFAPTDKNADCQEQLKIKADNIAAFEERDLITIVIKDEKWYKKYGVKPKEFVVILIGKDGSPKIRDFRPFTMQRLIKIIDSMPMRQDEMKRQ